MDARSLQLNFWRFSGPFFLTFPWFQQPSNVGAELGSSPETPRSWTAVWCMIETWVVYKATMPQYELGHCGFLYCQGIQIHCCTCDSVFSSKRSQLCCCNVFSPCRSVLALLDPKKKAFLQVTTKMPKLIDNACLWWNKLDFHCWKSLFPNCPDVQRQPNECLCFGSRGSFTDTCLEIVKLGTAGLIWSNTYWLIGMCTSSNVNHIQSSFLSRTIPQSGKQPSLQRGGFSPSGFIITYALPEWFTIEKHMKIFDGQNDLVCQEKEMSCENIHALINSAKGKNRFLSWSLAAISGIQVLGSHFCSL